MGEPMLALTVRQPLAYLAGVVAGDGYLSRPGKNAKYGYLGLHVADEEFARAEDVDARHPR